MKTPRIALIHATPLAIGPINTAFATWWPEASCMNLLDDSLTADLVAAGRVDDVLVHRFGELARYAVRAGAAGILFSCSAFGQAIEAVAQTIHVPVLKPNEPMFGEALDIAETLGPTCSIGLVSTFAASVPSMRDELLRMAADKGISIDFRVECADGALDALNVGRRIQHDELVSQAAGRLQGCDVLLLGQFSMAHLRDSIAQETGVKVLSSPDSAVNALRSTLGA